MRIVSLVALVFATIAVFIALIAVAIGDEDRSEFDAVVVEDRRADDFENDLGERGESVGDVIGTVDPLERDGEESGTEMSLCTRTGTEEEPSAACTTTLDFPEGSIVAEGIFDVARRDESQEFAIIGGTGDYVGARGTVTVEAQESGNYLLAVDATMED